MKYFTEFYETEITNPHTCGIDYFRYHGVIYTYRKSWIRRVLKKKVVFVSQDLTGVFVKTSL